MSILRKKLLMTVTSAVLAFASTGSWDSSNAQSMTPMRGETKSFDSKFGFRVYPKNPYQHRIKVTVNVYDQAFNPVKANITPQQIMLGGGASRPVLVQVPFDGNTSRKVRICTESIPFPNEKQIVRAQICGKFLATKIQ